MHCCANCFEHPWLKHFVRENSDATGQCEFCEADDVQLLATDELAQAFHNLLSMYIPAETFEEGELILNLINWDWEVFSEDLPENKQRLLLEDIANSGWDDDNGEPELCAKELYMRKSNRPLHNTHRQTWEQFCSDVRDDPQTTIPLDEFIAEKLGEAEETLAAGAILWRARIGYTPDENKERVPFRGAEIDAPPPDKATAGRANAKGHVVLYVADQEKTAVSEIRPALGFYVSVATLQLNRVCRVLDLTKDLPELSPFDQEQIGWFVEMRSLLNRLGEEMSIPLEHSDDQRTYIPCQRFSDFIRENRYDGIRYASALNPGGSNVVFFDPNVAQVTGAKLVKVTQVKFEYEVDDEPRFADRWKSFAAQFNAARIPPQPEE